MEQSPRNDRDGLHVPPAEPPFRFPPGGKLLLAVIALGLIGLCVLPHFWYYN
ncbi:MAG TPA: hypothetical protein VGE07_25165 [Herpetosiphonaceae bacterium]